MEGEGRPAEITQLIRDLRTAAEDQRATGEWLATAMQRPGTWPPASSRSTGLADMLGERHRIIANDWQAANMTGLTSRILDRAADILDDIDFTPAALRADLDTTRTIDRAALLRRRADLPRRRPRSANPPASSTTTSDAGEPSANVSTHSSQTPTTPTPPTAQGDPPTATAEHRHAGSVATGPRRAAFTAALTSGQQVPGTDSADIP